MQIKGKRLARLFYKFILEARLYHLFFWIVYTLFVAIALQPGQNPREWLLFSSLILMFHAGVSYFNNYYLVNRFLYGRQYLTYIILLALSIIAASFPISIIIHKLVNNQDLKNMVWSWNFFLLIMLSVLFSVVLSMVLKLLKNWYQEEQTNRQLQKINLETELKFLKSQINPHFLFNSLNNLYALTLKKSEQAPEVVLRLSNILRYVLYETGEGRVPLEKEIQYLRDYIDLERIRVGDRVDIRFETHGDSGGKLIEPMLLLTFVENSFKHGAAQSLNKAWINIDLDAREDAIVFTVANSKENTSPTDTKTPGGIGMVNLRKRLDLIYRGAYDLAVNDQPESYTVQLTINN